MHRLGVMHRDLKPDNVIVFLSPGCGPTLKITDFGSALARASTSPMPCLSQMINTHVTKRMQLLYAAVDLILEDQRYLEKDDV